MQDAKEQLNQADADLGAVQDELVQTTKDLGKTREELEKTNKELEETTQKLESANVFVSHAYPIHPEDIKGGSLDQFPAQEELLFYILELQAREVQWNRNGVSEEEGFNSPSFAVYVLKYFGLISSDYNADAKPWQIGELVPVGKPSMGDIVYYENGYTMFYYELNGESFVIGMTPLGIISQTPDFADNPRYLHVPYR